MNSSQISLTNDQVFGLVSKKEKFSDTRSVQAITSTGAIASVVLPPTGTEAYQRVGDTITLNKLDIQGYFIYGDVVGNVVRFVIFQTRGGFVPSNVGDIFGTGATGSIDVTSPWLQYIPGRKVHVLYDGLVSLQPGANSAITVFKKKMNLKIKEIEFAQGTSTPQDGAIYWAVISDSSLTPSPALDIVFRLTFHDV